MFNKAYQGDMFEVLDEAYKEDPSNVIGMIKVMRPNQSGGFTNQTCEVPKQFAMDSIGIPWLYYIKQIILDEADKMVSSGVPSSSRTSPRSPPGSWGTTASSWS